MMTEKFKEGDIRPLYKFDRFEVCKKAAEKESDQIWVSTEEQSQAEILSFIFKNQKIKKE